MNERLKEIVIEYQRAVHKAYNLVKEGMNFPVPMHPYSWQSAYPSQRGSFGTNGENRFFLHGTGCSFKNEEFVVHWNFGTHGEYDGFESSFLADFIRENLKNIPEFANERTLIQALEQAVLEREMKVDRGFYMLLPPLN